jgi:cytochrome c biogenesis protein CcmG, thiol:disulfide interchange protein DsbE
MLRSLSRVGLPVVFTFVLALTGCGKSGKGANDPSSAGEGGGASSPAVGKPAPDLSIQTLNGKGKISLESLQGKIVIVDFWATWCAPCKQSFPKLEELSKKIGDKVEIVGISVDDDQKGVLEFAKETGVNFAIGWDEGHKLANKWNVKTMPTTFILDGTGKVRYVHDGYHDGEATLMGKEAAALADEPVDTKVAKNDAKPAEAKPADAKPADAKADAKTDAKTDAKPEPTADASSTTTTTGAATTGDDKGEAAPPANVKKGGKKGGRGAGKKAPPAPKKRAKKKAA